MYCMCRKYIHIVYVCMLQTNVHIDILNHLLIDFLLETYEKFIYENTLTNFYELFTALD